MYEFVYRKEGYTKASQNYVHVTDSKGAEVQGSPFQFAVFPAEVSAKHCQHSLTQKEIDENVTIPLAVFPFDEFNNPVVAPVQFEVSATLEDPFTGIDEEGVVMIREKGVLTFENGYSTTIRVPKGKYGLMRINVTLESEHIKGSPYEIVVKGNQKEQEGEVLDANTVVTAVLGGGGIVFVSFAVYKAATKKGRENVMDEVTEARKCLLPFVLDLVDIATDVGE